MSAVLDKWKYYFQKHEIIRWKVFKVFPLTENSFFPGTRVNPSPERFQTKCNKNFWGYRGRMKKSDKLTQWYKSDEWICGFNRELRYFEV